MSKKYMASPTIKKGDTVKCRQSGELGTVIDVIYRGAILSPLFVVRWNDIELGQGTLFEHEFEVVREE